jgi:hypothetical protein
MNGHHEITRRGDPAGRQTKQGAGRRISGACRARVKFGQRLLPFCTALCILAPAKLWALSDMAPPSATTFAYRVSHPVTPLPDTVIEKIADAENGADAAFEEDMTRETDVKTPRRLSRPDLCRTLASVAHANELPVPFFSNLIWHESSFNTGTISRAGAQGIAQFMPRTAAMYDLINPFEPIHAINVAGKFLKELHQRPCRRGLQRRPQAGCGLDRRARRPSDRDPALRDADHRPAGGILAPGQGTDRARGAAHAREGALH